MAVDPAGQRRDVYYGACSDEDERVELDGWTYYVRAVKWRDQFTPGRVPRSGSALFDSLVELGRHLMFDRRRPWLVGVVRLGSVSTWNDLTPKLVHHEALAQGVDPQWRIAELVEEVRTGRFRPT